MEWSSASLRLLRAIAETGSFTSAANSLRYTQSAVSRQVALLERAAGVRLFDRHRGGVTLTSQGWLLLHAASDALDVIDRAEREMHGTSPVAGVVHLGVNHSVGAALVPRALALLRTDHPAIEVMTRDATSGALARSLRARSIELALVASVPPFAALDNLTPPLKVHVLLEGELLVAVAAGSSFAQAGGITLDQLQTARWIASPRSGDSPVFGVWPALPSTPRVNYYVQDWLAKLNLVAQGWGITTVPPTLAVLLPPDVRLVRVVDGAPVIRRAVVRWLPTDLPPASKYVMTALQQAAADLPIT